MWECFIKLLQSMEHLKRKLIGWHTWTKNGSASELPPIAPLKSVLLILPAVHASNVAKYKANIPVLRGVIFGGVKCI